MTTQMTPAGTHMVSSGSFAFLREEARKLPIGDILITPTGYVYIVEGRANVTGAAALQGTTGSDVRLVNVPKDGQGLPVREAKHAVEKERYRLDLMKAKREAATYLKLTVGSSVVSWLIILALVLS